MHSDTHADSHEHTSTDLHSTARPTSTSNTTHHRKQTSLKELIAFALIVFAIVIPIRVFIAKPFIVEGTSMYPTFDTFHYLIVDQISYRFHEPQRGDVVVFRFPLNNSKFLIKRIIGLPHERVVLHDTTTTIYNEQHPDGFVLSEPYVQPKNALPSDMSVTLGDNEYFVMGDNRKVSADSRYWGPLERERIIGRAYMRLFPFSQIETFPGAVSYTTKTK